MVVFLVMMNDRTFQSLAISLPRNCRCQQEPLPWQELLQQQVEKLHAQSVVQQQLVEASGREVLLFSSVTGQGLKALMDRTYSLLIAERQVR